MPTVNQGTEWLWQAWAVLTARRVLTADGPQAISMSDIHAYALYNEFDSDQRELLLVVLRALDEKYLEYVRDKIRKDRQKKRPGPTPRKR